MDRRDEKIQAFCSRSKIFLKFIFKSSYVVGTVSTDCTTLWLVYYICLENARKRNGRKFGIIYELFSKNYFQYSLFCAIIPTIRQHKGATTVEKIRRNERMSAMMKILSASPNRIFTLSYFCELFGAAKSTMSEDIDILRDVVKTFQLGELETVTGAAGGVRYRPRTSKASSRAYIASLCEKLSN